MFTSLRVMFLVSIAVGTACTADTNTAFEDSQAKGAALLLPFKQSLKSALLAGLEEGAVNAISVCKDEAPVIAAGLSIDGVKVGRASHRLRNPANASPAWASSILESYLQAETERKPMVQDLPNNRTGYAEPIMVQPLCLACHGKSLAPEVAARINETYPNDAATGFEVGDLRGLYWVEFPQRSSRQ